MDHAGNPLDIVFQNGVQAKISNSIIGVDDGGFIDKGGNLIGVDPKLGPLSNNGGLTKTFALLEGSPALDAGAATDDPVVRKFDQRGKPFRRVIDGDGDGTSAPDTGAFERQNQ